MSVISKIVYGDTKRIPHLYFSDKDMLKFYTELFENKFYQKIPISNQWQPTAILNLKTDTGKLIMANKTFWVITEKVKTAIEPLLKETVEYLPLINRRNVHKIISRVKQFTHKKIFQPIIEGIHEEQQYIINILNIKEENAIDFEKSDLNYDIQEESIIDVNKLVFIRGEIEGAHMFKIKNPGQYFQMTTFVSKPFKKLAEKQDFSGVKFEAC